MAHGSISTDPGVRLEGPLVEGSPLEGPLLEGTGLEPLGRELARVKADDPLTPVAVVTPSAYSAVFVRRALGAWPGTDGRRGWANLNVTTVPALLDMLGGPPLAAGGLRPAPPAVDLEVIRTEAVAGSPWLASCAAHPSGLVELQRALVELRRCPPPALDAISGRRGPGADLVGLLRAVHRTLRASGLADAGDLWAEATAAAGSAGGPAAAGSGLGPLLTWQLGSLGPPEQDLLRLLGARPVDPSPGGDPPATLTEIRPCSDPDEEARSALRSIIAGAEAGVPLWQQAVFHPPGPTYARILHQHLTEAGVPSNGPERRRLHHCMTGRALLGLLELAGGPWPRDRVLAWLSSAPVTVGRPGRLVPASRWDVISADAGVIGGPGQWQERLGRRAALGGPDTEDASALAAFMAELVHRATPPDHTWTALSAWAVGLLDHYLRPDDDPGRWPADENAAAHQVRQAVATLADLDRVSGGADLPTFRQAVRTQLERTPVDAHERADGGFGDGVFVAPYAGSPGLRFDSVVVVGLADALVPGASGGDGLLSDEVRSADPSGTLGSRLTRREGTRRDLWSAVGAGSRLRVGTLPRGDSRTGRAQVPSRWLRRLVTSDTIRREVDSFAAGLTDAGPAITVGELRLRRLDSVARGGGDPATAPGTDERLTRGFAATVGRQAARFTRFDGWVGPGQVSAFDPGTPVSATRFETYAKCPRRFLFDRVLRVSARVRPEELWRIEPMTRGTLVHGILEEYVAERVAGAPRSLDRLLALAAVRLDDTESGGLVGKPLLWQLDRAAIVRDLRRFHVEEGVMEPIAAELSFGLGPDDDTGPVTVVLDDGRSVAFHGSVDRVDRTSSGQLMVSDYKTGRQGHLSDLTRDPVAGGKLLQLPLYAMAARDRFGGPRPVHARYWLLSGERSAPCFHLVVTDGVQRRFRQVVGLIADGVEGGCFPGVPGAPTYGRFSHCTGCDFDDVCPTTRDRQWNRLYNTPELRGVVDLVGGDVPDELAGSVVKRFVDPDGTPDP